MPLPPTAFERASAVVEGSDRLVNIDQVAKILSVSRSTFEKMRNRSEFPDPDFRIAKRQFWFKTTVTTWLASKYLG